MANRRLMWDLGDTEGANRDIHVLRGVPSRSLVQDLDFKDEHGRTDVAQGQVVFQPLFKATPNGDWLEGLDVGIKVNSKTGVVDFLPGEPARIKNNFIIEIKGAGAWITTNTELIRVQVHSALYDAWLSPQHLTVRPSPDAPTFISELTFYRFTVRALFDDGITGDVTLNHGVQWSAASGPQPMPSGLLILEEGIVPPKDVQITATLPAAWGGPVNLKPSGTLRIRPRWDKEPDPPKAEIVVGSAWPGTVQPDGVPNILVVGDGFRGGDSGDFDGIVDTIVKHLATDQLTRPFDLLTSRMNFWKVFVPSDDLGISYRSEVFTWDDDGRTWAAAVPTVQKYPGHGEYGIEHLLYDAGLPVVGDLFDENADPRTPASFRAEWAALLDTNLAFVPDDLIEQWKLLATRGFIEELDNFPGMSYGLPPAANSPYNTILDHHEYRGSSEALKPFYKVLAAANGVTTAAGARIGDLWVTKDPHLYVFDNTDLVLLISAIDGGRAQNSTGYLALSRDTDEYAIPVVMIPGRAEWRLDLTDPPSGITTDRCRATAHELGHSFGLGDEYAEFEGDYPGVENDLNDSANLQTEFDAQIASTDAHGDPIRVVDADQIKWNWHRIYKAAVISDKIEEAGDVFRVPLVPGQGLQFKTGDSAILRLRSPGVPLRKRPRIFGDKTLGQELQFTDPPDVTVLVLPDDVEAYKRGDIRYIKPAAGSTAAFADLQDFKSGSILYTPAPAPASVPAGHPYAEMVAWNIKELINKNRAPLTRKPGAPCVTDTSKTAQWPILHDVTIRTVWAYSIVGLYSGGGLWGCKIFHPAGLCVMRYEHDDDTVFCAVCRYVMVDMIDPYRHFEIDRDLEENYPQPVPGDSYYVP